MKLPDRHHEFLDRFVAACTADRRVLAAFLGGSHAEGTADSFSDLDLYLITSDQAFEDFLAHREAFVRGLGQPWFLEDFGIPDALFFILSGHIEGELWIGRQSSFLHLHEGPFEVLLDKSGILSTAVFAPRKAEPATQLEILRQQLAWFWHEVSHFIKAMGRGQLWFAYGQLEALRQICVRLARLEHNFADAHLGEEPYFKVEQALPVEQLAPLQNTLCGLDFEAMLQAGFVLIRFYEGVAPRLAAAHQISYQPDLANGMIEQLESLGNIRRE